MLTLHSKMLHMKSNVKRNYPFLLPFIFKNEKKKWKTILVRISKEKKLFLMRNIKSSHSEVSFRDKSPRCSDVHEFFCGIFTVTWKKANSVQNHILKCKLNHRKKQMVGETNLQFWLRCKPPPRKSPWNHEMKPAEQISSWKSVPTFWGFPVVHGAHQSFA